MNDYPYLSVVIPTYNSADYIEETLQSLLREQELCPWLEIIVIDDGSTDSTEEKLSQLPGKFTYIKQTNQGQSAALNHGWKLSQGDWISYLSSDDIIHPGWIQKAYDFLKNSNYIGCYPNYNLIDENSRPISFVEAPEFKRFDLIVHSLCQPGPGAVFKKDDFNKTSGWNTSLRQTPDFDFWIRLSEYGDLCKVNFNGAGFRVHQNSQSYASPSSEKAEEPVQVIQNFFSTNSSSLKTFRPLALSNAHLLSARLHARALRPKQFLSHCLQAFILSPSNFIKLKSLRLMASGWAGRLHFQIKKLIASRPKS